MSGNKLIFTVGILLPVLMAAGTAFGWAGTTHALLCQRNFDDPKVAQFLGGVNQSAIENYISEPNEASHNVQWESILNRKYIDTATPCSNGFDWNALDETTRLQYLQHHLGDCSVPAHHKPAYYEYPDSGAINEGQAEAQAAVTYTSLGDFPNMVNTNNYTHTETSNSFSLTGTIDEVVDTYYDACIDNAHYYRITENMFGFHDPWDVADAVWNAMKIDLILQRAVMVDYFLAKETPVIDPIYAVGQQGQFFLVDYSDAYDPDCISWNSNGTYTQQYGLHDQGLQGYYFDFNCDSVWDMGYNQGDSLYFSADVLIDNFGYQTDAWNPYYLAVTDNEGKAGIVVDYIYLYSSGAMPEPATLSLLAFGGLALLRRRK